MYFLLKLGMIRAFFKYAAQPRPDQATKLCLCAARSWVSQAQTIITCSNSADVPTWPKFQACLLFFSFLLLQPRLLHGVAQSITQKVQVEPLKFDTCINFWGGSNFWICTIQFRPKFQDYFLKNFYSSSHGCCATLPKASPKKYRCSHLNFIHALLFGEYVFIQFAKCIVS